jgi:predicted dienelactone hydrolase
MSMPSRNTRIVVLVIAALCLIQRFPQAQQNPASVAVCDAGGHDAARSRDVPVRIRVPGGTSKVPVVLFSHGLGGSVDAGTTWAEAWSQNGLAVVHLQHPGSDSTLLTQRGGGDALTALRTGMTGAQLIARAADVRFALDELGRRRTQGTCDLSRIDLARAGMSGHSFGAHTTQAVAGQAFPNVQGRTLRDARIRAAIAFSPAPPRASEDVIRASFEPIAIPFFSITGTKDEVPELNDVTPEQRTLPYRYMPSGQKYLLVLDGADHAAFGGNARLRRGALRGRAGGNGNALVDDVVKTVTTAFWKATLLDDRTARGSLAIDRVKPLLVSGDRYEAK